jgi:hypothetical protein
MYLTSYLLDLLDKKQKDFTTLRSVRDSMPVKLLKDLGLVKGKSSLKSVKEKIIPGLDKRFKVFDGSRTLYLGFNLSVEEMILKRLQKNPRVSSKQLRNQLPFKNEEFIGGINKLMVLGRISCELNHKTHLPKSFHLLERKQAGMKKETTKDDAVLFEEAFKSVGGGRHFVRIHEIRSYLGWSDARFDTVLENLKSNLTIQLQGGDPSMLTKEELAQSYTDNKGRIRITVNWVK